MYDHLIGTRVRYGTLVGKVVAVTETHVLVQGDGEDGFITKVMIPEHLRVGKN